MVNPSARRAAAAAWIAAAALWLAACGAGGDPAREAAAPARAASPEAKGAVSRPDLDRGELLSFACRACHSLEAGEANDIGPNLHGVFGRRAGTLPDFEFSEALRESGIVWSGELLDRWLAEPEAFLPGTSMEFAGYRAASDRRDLVAYLELATAPAAGHDE